MSEFKVGDRVKCTDKPRSRPDSILSTGEVFTIVEVHGRDAKDESVDIKSESGQVERGWFSSRFELIEPLETQEPPLDGNTTIVYQAPGHPPQIDIGNGRTTKSFDYHLIPTVSIRRLAKRFALGEVRKGEKAWNAGSKYQDVLTNKPFIIERLNHVIDHAMKLRDEIQSGSFGKDDNAGAISWAGAFLCAATDAMGFKEDDEQSPS